MKHAAFLSLFALIFFAGCSMNQELKCSPPYIQVGLQCCLDQNNNSICDTDEISASNTSGQEPVCNSPYILVGTGCCLDKNNNSICDKDEENETLQASLCNPPYFEYRRGECCLDLDANQVCDMDETSPESLEPQETDAPNPCINVTCDSGKYCFNGTCILSPNFSTIPPMQVQIFSWCGDGVCSKTENESKTCCTDCGCEKDQYCSNNTCKNGTPIFTPFKYIPTYINLTNYPTGEPELIKGDTRPLICPSIYGNKIVYSSKSLHEYNVHIYDIYTRNTSKLSSSDNYAIDPDIYGAKIVWSEYNESGPNQIKTAYYYDLVNGVEGPIAPRTTSKNLPKIGSSYIVWQESPNEEGGSLHSYHIASATERIFFSQEDSVVEEPRVWEKYAVWTTADCDPSGLSCFHRLYLSDLVTGNGEILLATDDYIWGYSIGGSKIAYIRGQINRISTNEVDYDLQVYVYDIATKTTKKLTNTNSRKSQTSTDGNTVVWVDGIDGYHTDIFAYNLSEDKVAQITNDTRWEQCPDVYGNKLVYLAGTSHYPSYALYLYYLS